MGDRIILLNRLAENVPDENPLTSLRESIVLAANDWSQSRAEAWVYGIVVGWDPDPDDEPDEDDGDVMGDLAERFGWSDAQVARLRRLHDAFRRLDSDADE